MKTPIRTPLRAATAALLLATTLAAQAAGSLTLTPSAAGVAPGDSFSVQVAGSGFTDAVVGGGFELAFDPTVLRLTGVLMDTVTWEFLTSPGQADHGAGSLVDVYFNSFKSVLPTGSFDVATLTFEARAPGLGTMQLAPSAIFPFSNDRAEVIAVDFGGAGVTVSAVPEPGAMALWAAGLAAMGWRLRRRAS